MREKSWGLCLWKADSSQSSTAATATLGSTHAVSKEATGDNSYQAHTISNPSHRGARFDIQSAPAHRRGGPTIKWPGPTFLFKQASKTCHSHFGFVEFDLFARNKRDECCWNDEQSAWGAWQTAERCSGSGSDENMELYISLLFSLRRRFLSRRSPLLGCLCRTSA